MHTKYLLVDERGYGQTVKAVGEHFPESNIKPPLALIIKPVYSINLCILVVPPQEEDFIRVQYFVS